MSGRESGSAGLNAGTGDQQNWDTRPTVIKSGYHGQITISENRESKTMGRPTLQINTDNCVYVEIDGFTICIDTSIHREGISIGYWQKSDGGSLRSRVGTITLPNTEDLEEVDGFYVPATNQPTLYVSKEEFYGE